MSRIMGRVQVKANGQLQESHPGATLDPGGPVRTSVVGANSVHGYTEQIRQSKCEFEISIKAGTSLADIGRWNDITLTLEADTGQTWVISHGWVTEPPTFTDNEGKTKVIVEGPPAEEMMS